MGSPHLIHDELDLGIWLRDVGTPDQKGVVVVITTRKGQHWPDFDAEELNRQVPEARVVVVPAHLCGRAVDTRLPNDLSVYGGAARIYPVHQPGQAYVAPYVTAQQRSATESLRELVQETRDAVARSRHQAAPTARKVSAHGVERPEPAIHHGTQGQIDTPERAQALAHHLLDPKRHKPVLLATRRAGSHTAPVHLDQIRDAVGTLVDIVEMPTGIVSWAFANTLADFPGTECYGGAARVYPVGQDWTTKLALSPLRFTWDPAQAQATTDALIRDALAAVRTGHQTITTVRTEVSGKVQGIVSGRALVALDGGGNATIWPELTAPAIDAQQLVRAGMRVTGQVDQASGRLDVTGMLVEAGRALAEYQPDSLVLSRVAAVQRQLAVVEPFPDVQIAVPVEEIIVGNAAVDLRQWLSVGEVVTARIITGGEDFEDWEMSLADVDPDTEPLTAPSLLPGGPPWLTPPEPALAPPEPALASTDDVVRPEPTYADIIGPPDTPPVDEGSASEQIAMLQDELRAMTVERDALARRLATQGQESERLDRELRTLRTRARESDGRAARATKQQAAAEAKLTAFEHARADRQLDADAFQDPEEQFRYEVHLEWARRIPAAEKASLPLTDYQLGPDFLTTLGALSERDRMKTLEVVVDVITGRVHQLAGRQTHQLRSGPGGSDPYVTRADGSTCWRVSLQHKTPQARRLHYWMLPNGTSELSSVRTHDDMRA